jgi:MoxR-like ATPase
MTEPTTQHDHTDQTVGMDTPDTSRAVTAAAPTPPEVAQLIVDELRTVVVGQDRMVERLVCALLSGGHVLLEGVPGVGKTMTLTALAKVVGGEFSRIQFTSDLLPSDILGTRVFSSSTGEFTVSRGPIFANFVLADEINRAPAKVQSALLEVMAEKQVTIAGESHQVPSPFLVLATQNPIESEGVFPLPEAQRDRFMMRLIVPLPTLEQEREIARRHHAQAPAISQKVSLDELIALQHVVSQIPTPDPVVDYAVRLTMASRFPEEHNLEELAGAIRLGASPRATLAMLRASRAMAVMRGRSVVSAQDVYDVAFDVLNHRILLSYDAIADGVSTTDVCATILRTVLAPRGSR